MLQTLTAKHLSSHENAMFTKFRDECPTQTGFYVFRYENGREQRLFTDTIEPSCYMYGTTRPSYKYFIIMHNTRDVDTPHDFGEYAYSHGYGSGRYGPIEWRKMEVDEALAFSNNLCRFGRPYWHHKNGRNPLTLAQVEAIQNPK